ncbi:MAG: hypothetical protein PHR47_01310 [Candidatus Pacebacteria bacterium]|nr:hypothetical protein [Candidatus Paceibacterota bacterium]
MDTDKIIGKLKIDLKNAIMNRDTITIETIRCLISDIDNAGAVKIEQPEVMPMSGGIAGATNGIGSSEIPRKELFDRDVIKIIQKQIAEINEAMMLIKGHNEFNTLELEEKIKILEKYLEFID